MNFEDEIFSEDNFLDALYRFAQQADNEAKLIATKLAKNLLEQANQESGTTSELYVKDLVNLDAYLNFLLSNEERYDGKLIVFHNATNQDISPPDAQLYFKYKDFYVLKEGLSAKLRDLDILSNQQGNEVMKPLVKSLISESNKSLSLNFESMHGKAPGEPDFSQPNQKSKVQVGFSADESAVSGEKNENTAKTTSLEEDVMGLRNVMPFQSNISLSPYDMTAFIRGVNQIVHKHKDFLIGPILGQFEQFNQDIESQYNQWHSRVAEMNAASLGDEVPFDRARRPGTTLEQLFHGTMNAREVAQRLLQMVNLVQQALMSINRSPKLSDLLGKDVLSHQLAEAQSFADSLGAISR